MPKDRFRLVVGLGNPGEAYRLTRHNIGFMVLDALARRHNILVDKRQFEALFGVGLVEKRSVILAKPMTFMNLSGRAVRNLVHFFNLATKDLFVIHDDIDLVFGKIKIRQRGGDGGHKGLKSLTETLGSDAFARIRIGIGRPGTKQEVEGYVLNGFDAQQEEVLYKVITMAQDAVETILLKGLTRGMNCFSGKEV